MKKIESKEDIKLFRKEIKKELKSILSNVEDNLDEVYGLELLNDDDKYICHMFARAGMTTPDLDRITYRSITIADTLHGNDFDLNKYTSDYQLRKVANQIIDKYNEIVDDVIEYRKASEKTEAEWREKYGIE